MLNKWSWQIQRNLIQFFLTNYCRFPQIRPNTWKFWISTFKRYISPLSVENILRLEPINVAEEQWSYYRWWLGNISIHFLRSIKSLKKFWIFSILRLHFTLFSIDDEADEWLYIIFIMISILYKGWKVYNRVPKLQSRGRKKLI